MPVRAWGRFSSKAKAQGMTSERDWKSDYLGQLDLQDAREMSWAQEQGALRECLVALAGTAWGRDKQLDRLLQDLRNEAREGAPAAELLIRSRAALDLVIQKLHEEPAGESGQPVVQQPTTTTAIQAATVQVDSGLLALLDALDYPAEMKEAFMSLRTRVANPAADDSLAGRVRELASLLGMMRASLIAEKNDFQAFLQSVSSRIEALQSSLARILGTQDDASAAGRALQQDFSAHLAGMRESVDAATDLEELKASVGNSLANVELMVGGFLHQVAERDQQVQQQLETMSADLSGMRDESARLHEELEQERKRSTLDGLTGLLNRLALDMRLQQEMARWKRQGHPLSVIMLDVDHFKQVNDKFGHQTGDRVLCELARRMAVVARESDIVARYGGEEFVLVLPDTNLEQARIVAGKLRETVARLKFRYEQNPVPVTISAGVAQVRRDEDMNAVMSRVDQALYRAKEGGRNRVMVAP